MNDIYFKNETTKTYHICEKCDVVQIILSDEDPTCFICGGPLSKDTTELTFIQSNHTATVSC